MKVNIPDRIKTKFLIVLLVLNWTWFVGIAVRIWVGVKIAFGFRIVVRTRVVIRTTVRKKIRIRVRIISGVAIRVENWIMTGDRICVKVVVDVGIGLEI